MKKCRCGGEVIEMQKAYPYPWLELYACIVDLFHQG